MQNSLEQLVLEMLERGIRLPLAQRDFEKAYLKLALEQNRGSRLATARALGIHRNTLSNKLSKYRLRRNGRP